MPGLSQEQIDRFHRTGFLKIGKILEDDHIERLRAEYEAVFEREEHRALTASKEDTRVVKQIMQVSERSLEFRKLSFDDKILDIAQSLIGPNIQLFHDQAIYKAPRDAGPTSWHQDNAYWKCRPANLVSCWLTLDDVVKESGAMQFIPGSHLQPVWHGRSDGVLLDIGEHVDLSGAEVVELPAGGCTFHHCQTLHYTAPNTTGRHRRAYAIHFMPPGTWCEHDGGSFLRVGFERPMLRMTI